MSDSLQSHEPQHSRPPCPSPTPRVHPNPCPLSRWCHPTTSSSHPLLLLPSIFPSIRVFSNESALGIRWPKYWSFSFKISPSNEHPGLIFFRMDWLDLLAVQETLKSLLQLLIMWMQQTKSSLGKFYSDATQGEIYLIKSSTSITVSDEKWWGGHIQGCCLRTSMGLHAVWSRPSSLLLVSCACSRGVVLHSTCVSVPDWLET